MSNENRKQRRSKVPFAWFGSSAVASVLLAWQGAGFWAALLVFLICAFFFFSLKLTANRTGDLLASFIEGRGTISLEEQFAGELRKARHLKARKEFGQALAAINSVLEKLPQHAEALLLKAQILSEGFASYAAAKDCLEKIIRLKSVPDETIRRWAKEMLREVDIRRRLPEELANRALRQQQAAAFNQDETDWNPPPSFAKGDKGRHFWKKRKARKDIDAFARTRYWRIFYNLTVPCAILAAAAYFHLGWKAILLALLVNILFPFLLGSFADQTAEWFAEFCMGSGYSSATPKAQLDAELSRAKYFKAQKYFLAALDTVNSILVQMPEHPHALLLKAQIVSEGFADYAAAKVCLKKIIAQESLADKTVRQWAVTLLEEANAHLQRARLDQ